VPGKKLYEKYGYRVVGSVRIDVSTSNDDWAELEELHLPEGFRYTAMWRPIAGGVSLEEETDAMWDGRLAHAILEGEPAGLSICVCVPSGMFCRSHALTESTAL
jgi:hypothetical protein